MDGVIKIKSSIIKISFTKILIVKFSSLNKYKKDHTWKVFLAFLQFCKFVTRRVWQNFSNFSNSKWKTFKRFFKKCIINVKPWFQAHILIFEYHFISRSDGHAFMSLFCYLFIFLLFGGLKNASFKVPELLFSNGFIIEKDLSEKIVESVASLSKTAW